MHIFFSFKVFVKVYPRNSASEFPAALREFVKDIGAPEILVLYPHRLNKIKEVKAFCNIFFTTLRLLEHNTQWENCADLYVGLMKEARQKDIKVSGSPLFLWDYAAARYAEILSLMAREFF